MPNLRIDNNSYEPTLQTPPKDIWRNSPVNSTNSDSMSASGTGARLPQTPPQGVKTREEWNAFLDSFLYFDNVGAIRGPLQRLIDSAFNKGEVLDYDSLMNELTAALAQISPNYQNYKTIFDAFQAEKKLLTDWAADKLKTDKQAYQDYIKELKALLPFLSGEDLTKALSAIEQLERRLTLINTPEGRSPKEVLDFYLTNVEGLASLHEGAKKLIDELDGKKKLPDPVDPTPTPNPEIPLEEGESVRNQKTKGHGIGIKSGTMYYLEAFYKFSRACNNLISMNTAWGVELANLQKSGTQLSIKCRTAMSDLLSEKMKNFDKDKTPTEIGIIQTNIQIVQEGFTAYQKQLETVMPLILEQPKNITKDLDKFMEAARSILQLLTTYANLRI